MGKYEPVGLAYFFGGQATDIALGTEGQFYYSQHIDFRKSPSSFTLLPKPANADGGVVVDLVQDMFQVNSGVRYALGDAGYIYKIIANGTWSVLSTLGEAGGAGSIYRSDVDHAYFTGQTKISRLPRVTTGAAFEQNWFERGRSTASTCYKTGGTNTYTVATTTDETTTNKRSFTSDIEPLYQIGVQVVVKGTGDWTLTLHDDANNVLTAVTITNANITAGQINYFVFSAPISIQRGTNGAGSALTYHFHLTSTVADGSIATTTASSMIDCDMELWANALVDTRNNLHPTINFSNFTLFGNGRYVAAYEPLQDSPTTADFNRHRLTLPPGFEVCGFAQKNLMCVIGAEKRSSSGEFQEGALFFWDGTAETYNDWWPVPEGSPEALFAHKNTVYFIAGGSLYRMRGGDEPIKIRTFRNTDSEYSSVADSTHVYPNMMTVRRGILLVGYPSLTTNVSLEYGIYSLGAITNEYPESFGFSYTTSNGSILNTGSKNLRLGMIKNYGDTLYISWRDDEATGQQYSVDIVNNSSVPAATGTIESLEYDDDRLSYFKKASNIIATFDPLPENTSVQLKYKLEGASTWEYSEAATESATFLVFPVGKEFLRAQFGADLTCDGVITPSVTSIFMFVDRLKNDEPLGS